MTLDAARDVDICMTYICYKPPQVPVREALLTLGAESVHKPRGSAVRAVECKRDAQVKAYYEKEQQQRKNNDHPQQQQQTKNAAMIPQLPPLQGLSYQEYNKYEPPALKESEAVDVDDDGGDAILQSASTIVTVDDGEDGGAISPSLHYREYEKYHSQKQLLVDDDDDDDDDGAAVSPPVVAAAAASTPAMIPPTDALAVENAANDNDLKCQVVPKETNVPKRGNESSSDNTNNNHGTTVQKTTEMAVICQAVNDDEAAPISTTERFENEHDIATAATGITDDDDKKQIESFENEPSAAALLVATATHISPVVVVDESHTSTTTTTTATSNQENDETNTIIYAEAVVHDTTSNALDVTARALSHSDENNEEEGSPNEGSSGSSTSGSTLESFQTAKSSDDVAKVHQLDHLIDSGDWATLAIMASGFQADFSASVPHANLPKTPREEQIDQHAKIILKDVQGNNHSKDGNMVSSYNPTAEIYTLSKQVAGEDDEPSADPCSDTSSMTSEESGNDEDQTTNKHNVGFPKGQRQKPWRMRQEWEMPDLGEINIVEEKGKLKATQEINRADEKRKLKASQLGVKALVPFWEEVIKEEEKDAKVKMAKE